MAERGSRSTDPGVAQATTARDRRAEREAFRRQRARRGTAIAAISTIVVLGGLAALILTSPGWDEVQRTFFSPDDFAEVSVAVLTPAECKLMLGVPLANRGIQAVWVRIANRSTTGTRLLMTKIARDYFTARELTTNSTRRFRSRPSSVVFAATGTLAPNPLQTTRDASIPPVSTR